jgi:hypothetical protein
MTMFGGGRDDDADDNPWLNAPLTDPNTDSIRPAIVTWLEMMRRNDAYDPAWDRMGGNDEGITIDDMTNMIMEEGSPTTLRNMMLNEYEITEHLLGSEGFRDDIEEHIMGYPDEFGMGDHLPGSSSSSQDDEFQEWLHEKDRLNFTSDSPIFTASADTIFDTVWGMMKSVEKGKFRGYTRNRISGRAERQGKARAWSQSRKVKRGKTRKRYARNKKRGNVRPQMRRQLGAGGKREQVKR